MEEIDVTIADHDNELPIEMFDSIIAEYQSSVWCDGVNLIVEED